MKQSVQVAILGQQFKLKSDAPPEQVHRVARFVEDQISQVTSSGRAVDSLQAAILALLNAPDSSEAEKQRLGQLIEKIEAALG